MFPPFGRMIITLYDNCQSLRCKAAREQQVLYFFVLDDWWGGLWSLLNKKALLFWVWGCSFQVLRVESSTFSLIEMTYQYEEPEKTAINRRK